MLDKVLASLLERDQVLLSVCIRERLARGDLRSSAVHLQRTGRRDDNDGVGLEAAHAALDVAELLHTHVGTEATFGEDVSRSRWVVAFFCTGEFESDPVGEDGGIAMSNIRERTSVDEDRRTLSS